jgi:iron complex outermembrane receptor protein
MNMKLRLRSLAATMAASVSITAFAAEVSGTTTLEEIIVTAQKRQQNLQDVPLAVTAFNAETIEDAGWRNSDQLQQEIPSLVIGGDGIARPFMFIRGVGTRKFDIGADGSVGVFVDDVYNTRYSTVMTGIVDLERIEVLKGPQGTLYGRNTIGGAISLFTAKPTNEFEGRVKAGVGDDGYYQVGGYVSGAVAENVAARLTLNTMDVDGVHEDTVSGKDDGAEMSTVRLSVLANPTDRLEIAFTGQYEKTEQDAFLSQPTPNPTTGSIFAISPTLPADEVRAELQRAANSKYKIASNIPGGLEVETNQMSLRAGYSADVIDFTSITSRSYEELQSSTDFDSTRYNIVLAYDDQESTQYSQEFRLNSTSGGLFTLGDRLTWVAGLFGFWDEAKRTDTFSFPEGGASLFSPDGVLARGVFRPPSGYDVAASDATAGVNLETTSYAAYGQATYAVTEKLSLTLGLRYSDDKKKYTYTLATNTPGFPFVSANESFDETLSFNSTDPRVTLDYQFTDSVMAYATYATGYKSGGAQYSSFNLAIARGGFDKETLDSFEVGIKSRLFDDRLQLNAALYEYDYQDQQVNSIVSYNGAASAFTSNAGQSDMQGLEIDLVALLLENITLNASYSYSDAKYNDFDHPETDRSGFSMEFAPENAYSLSLDYRVNVGQAGELALRAAYGWKDDYFIDSSNTPLSLQEAYGVFNLAAIWDINESLRLRAFCDNCNGEEYLTQTTIFPTGAGGGARNKWATPRRLGMEAFYSF